MLTLWGRANATNVKKVRWCLEELNVPYQRIDAGGTFGQLDTADYLARNPNGTIPVIDDQGFVLWESNAIMRYLVNQYDGLHLYPVEAKQRAIIDQWLDWSSSTLFPPFVTVLVGLIRTPIEKRDPITIEAGIKKLNMLFTMLNNQLANSTYLAGEQHSLADISLICFSYIWFNLPLERPELPHLARWYAQLFKHRLFDEVVALPFT